MKVYPILDILAYEFCKKNLIATAMSLSLELISSAGTVIRRLASRKLRPLL
jgi:hypothetical protein